MPVLLTRPGNLPPPTAYDSWFAVTGTGDGGPTDKKLSGLAHRLEGAFGVICPEWWRTATALADGPGTELAYATTAAGYGSDFGLMMAWSRLVEEMAAEPERCLVVCDDPWLFRHLAALSGVEAGKAPNLWTAAARLRLRGMAARVRLAARLALSALVTRNQRAAHGRGSAAILVYGHPQSTTGGDDAYFGPMMAEIAGLKRALHTDCGPRCARAMAADGRTASLHAWGNPWRAPALAFRRWRPRRPDLEGRFGWLVRRAAVLEGGGGAHGMNAWQRHCQESWLAATQPAVVAWPWENHGWERAFCRAARSLGITSIGYQHTVIGPHQLNYSPATNRDGEASLPDRIVCNGPAYRDQLADWGVPAARLVIGGSLRIKPMDGAVFDARGPCFVALSADRRIARQQLDAVGRAAAKGLSFLVKEHPMYPLTFEETDRIRRTDAAMGEQAGLSAVFYSTGTSGLEALLAGLPTFRLLPDDVIAVDVLPGFLSAEPVTVDGLADAFAAAPKPPEAAWQDVLAPVDWDLWRRLFEGDGTADTAPEIRRTQEKIA